MPAPLCPPTTKQVLCLRSLPWGNAGSALEPPPLRSVEWLAHRSGPSQFIRDPGGASSGGARCGPGAGKQLQAAPVARGVDHRHSRPGAGRHARVREHAARGNHAGRTADAGCPSRAGPCHRGGSLDARRARLPRRTGYGACHQFRRHPHAGRRQAAKRQLRRRPASPQRRRARRGRSAALPGGGRSGQGKAGRGRSPTGVRPEGPRPLLGAGGQGCGHAAGGRSAAGQGRQPQGNHPGRPGRDRKRRDPAQLRDDRRPHRRQCRLPPGRCRQHRPCRRSGADYGAHANQAGHGRLHPASARSRTGARSHAERERHRPRLRPGQHA